LIAVIHGLLAGCITLISVQIVQKKLGRYSTICSRIEALMGCGWDQGPTRSHCERGQYPIPNFFIDFLTLIYFCIFKC